MRFTVAGAGSPAPRTAVAGRSRSTGRSGAAVALVAAVAGEDAAIRAAVQANRAEGISSLESGPERKWRARRLEAVVGERGRTLAVVRKRAQRLGERSYRESWRRRPAA